MDVYMEEEEDYNKSIPINILNLLNLQLPSENGKTFLTQGNLTFYYYNCDNYDDAGWGCGYRTLQTICSWISNVLKANQSSLSTTTQSLPPTSATTTTITSSSRIVINNTLPPSSSPQHIINRVPSILEIQTTLINLCDKPEKFFGSRDWIGTLEAFYVIDALYDIPCKILHVPRHEDIKKYANIVKKYFEDYGGFIMMGGDVDCASKGIAGIHISGNQAYFLVIDPHYVGKLKSPQDLIDNNLIRWQHSSQFPESSFYNLLLPQIKLRN